MPVIQNVRFVVNKTPYCMWDLDIPQRNLDFINSIDPRYFEHIAKLHSDSLEGDEKQYAAVALRIAYSHGLESLFALLCAYVQAPDCIVGWLLKYQNKELYKVVRKISERERLYSKLRVKPVTWDVVADLVFSNFKTGDDEKDASIRRNFARLWRRFASDYLEVNHAKEYNNIKHGLRARMGGFYLAMGLEDVPGVPAPPEKMQTMVNSVFGSSFYILEPLHDRHNLTNFTIRLQGLNWDPINFIYALQYISMSINNVLGSLKLLYGVSIKEVPFMFSNNDESYEEPWKRQQGISSLGMNSQIPEEAITPLSKEEIFAVYSENREEDNESTNGEA